MRYRISAYLDDPGAQWRLKPRQDVYTDNADTAVTTYEAVSRVERCAGAALVHEASGEILMAWGYPDPDHPLTGFYAPLETAVPLEAGVAPEVGRDGQEGQVLRFRPRGGGGQRRAGARLHAGAARPPSAKMEATVQAGRVVVLSRQG